MKLSLGRNSLVFPPALTEEMCLLTQRWWRHFVFILDGSVLKAVATVGRSYSIWFGRLLTSYNLRPTLTAIHNVTLTHTTLSRSHVVVTCAAASSRQFGLPTLTFLNINVSVEDHVSNIRQFKPQRVHYPFTQVIQVVVFDEGHEKTAHIMQPHHLHCSSSLVCLDSPALQTRSDMSGSSCTDYTGICEPQTFILMEGLWANTSRHESVS